MTLSLLICALAVVGSLTVAFRMALDVGTRRQQRRALEARLEALAAPQEPSHTPAEVEFLAAPKEPSRTPAEVGFLAASGAALKEKATAIAGHHGMTLDDYMALSLTAIIRLHAMLPAPEKRRINRVFDRRIKAARELLLAGGDQ